MEIKQGYLLVTDISGYTEFLVHSELEHAKEILDSLLLAGINAIRAPVRVLNTRGDAILAFVDAREFLQPQTLLESIQSIYFDFRRQLAFMALNTTCECRACANIGALDLKIFLHFGEYIEQQLGEVSELQGADVILVNRLMKNRIKVALGLEGYALITMAAVEAMEAAELVEGMARHAETYEHFGRVPLVIWDLASDWHKECEKTRLKVDPSSAWIIESLETESPPWVAWDVATDPVQKRIYYDMISVERVDEKGGLAGEGSQYHCVHEMGDVTFTIVEWQPPKHFISEEVALGIPVRFTMQFVPSGSGTTIRIFYQEPREGDPEELEPLFRQAAREALDRLGEILKKREPPFQGEEISG